jgi:mono/diheme cytochrome c family protein
MNDLRIDFLWRALPVGALVAVLAASTLSAATGDMVRGAYLARIAGCIGCHTPRGPNGGVLESRLMSGGDHPIAGNLGRFFPPNITPDPTTGIGNWTVADIAKAITTGHTPDGRILSTAMPWQTQFRGMTGSDALAIALYMKSLPSVSNNVPRPLPSEGLKK